MMGGSENLRISVLVAVYGFRVSFLSLCIFLGYEFNVMAVSVAVCAFALKTSVKSMTVAFIVKYICKIK